MPYLSHPEKVFFASGSGRIRLTAEIAAFICRKLHQKRLRQSKVMKFEAHANAEKFMIIDSFDVNSSHLAGIFPGIHLYLSPGFSSYTFFNGWQYTCNYSVVMFIRILRWLYASNKSNIDPPPNIIFTRYFKQILIFKFKNNVIL